MSWYTDARAAIYPLVESTLSGMTRQLDDQTANRMSIRELLEQYERWEDGAEEIPAPGLNTPFAVYDWGSDSPRLGPTTNYNYRQATVRIYYVVSIEGKTAEQYMSELETAGAGLKDAFWDYSGTAFSTIERGVIDTSPTNPAAEVFVRYNLPYAAAMFETVIIGGEV